MCLSFNKMIKRRLYLSHLVITQSYAERTLQNTRDGKIGRTINGTEWRRDAQRLWQLAPPASAPAPVVNAFTAIRSATIRRWQ